MEEQENSVRPPGRERNVNRWVNTLILLLILVVIVVVGFIAVDTLVSLTRPVTGLPGAVSTQVQQVLNPTPTIIASPTTIVRQVQALSRLETASYTIEKVITAESGEGPLGFLFRDRLLLVAQGQVIAGVDLSRIQREDVQVVGTTVYMTMPAAEIFVATLNNSNTYVYDRQTGVLGQQIDLETLARQQAERAILDAALEDGILDMAQRNADQTVEGLLRALGFEEVVFIQGTPSPGQNRGTQGP